MGKDEVDVVPVATAVLTENEATPLVNAPAPYGGSTQSWKDGLCSCCKYGFCHPHLWNACCCPQILMSQVLTRLHYDMFGNPTSNENIWKNTFRRVVVLVIIYYMIMSIFGCSYSEMDLADDDDLTADYDRSDCPTWRRIIQNVVGFAMFLYTLIVMSKTRSAVRAKYNISTKRCGNCEDCCCVFWCGCCTVAQLARQTADYDTYHSVCCSPTGLTENAPPLVETLTPAVLV